MFLWDGAKLVQSGKSLRILQAGLYHVMVIIHPALPGSRVDLDITMANSFPLKEMPVFGHQLEVHLIHRGRVIWVLTAMELDDQRIFGVPGYLFDASRTKLATRQCYSIRIADNLLISELS